MIPAELSSTTPKKHRMACPTTFRRADLAQPMKNATKPCGTPIGCCEAIGMGDALSVSARDVGPLSPVSRREKWPWNAVRRSADRLLAPLA